MAKSNEKVMALVEKELKKKPGASVDELYDKAVKVDKAVEKLSKRQFNARYPLQVKRRKSSGKSGGRKRSRKKATARRTRRSGSDGVRESVRAVFLRFASDLAAAEARKDVVKVVAGVDKYVDDAIKAAGK